VCRLHRPAERRNAVEKTVVDNDPQNEGTESATIVIPIWTGRF
jgi:hypothetical protein